MRPLWSWHRIRTSVWEGLRVLSIVTDTELDVRHPLGHPLASSKQNMSSVIAEGRNGEPCEHAVNSGPASSISQLIMISSNAAFKWWIVSSCLFFVWRSSLMKKRNWMNHFPREKGENRSKETLTLFAHKYTETNPSQRYIHQALAQSQTHTETQHLAFWLLSTYWTQRHMDVCAKPHNMTPPHPPPTKNKGWRTC